MRAAKERLDAAGITNQGFALRQASGEAFYNTSPFRLRDLTSRGQSQRLRADFEAYLDGFSPNVQRCWTSSSSATRFPLWWRRTPWLSRVASASSCFSLRFSSSSCRSRRASLTLTPSKRAFQC